MSLILLVQLDKVSTQVRLQRFIVHINNVELFKTRSLQILKDIYFDDHFNII